MVRFRRWLCSLRPAPRQSAGSAAAPTTTAAESTSSPRAPLRHLPARHLCVQASGIGSLCCGEDRPKPCSGEARQLAWTQAGWGALTRLGGLGGAFASPPGAEALDGQLDRTLVITGAVDVAPKRPVERVEVGAREAAGSGRSEERRVGKEC